ncbi:aspartic proteinase CDR1-like [Phragmites australis]|uniref:aspartic proteinase CDR1-like n=1 Tax=Phragmites australis TaxID=29695 RepID=UPI002D7708D4|nr:aspartic proteinase CDR1-like [Phragmites australis]
MEATMLRALLLFSLLLAGKRCCTASGAGGFSVEFIHRDSARSPFHEPALSSHGRMLAAARRSLQAEASARSGRSASPASAPAPGDGVESKVISRSFEYLMAVNVGTPPRQMLAIADTGSDLVWFNCRNGSDSRAPAAGGASPLPAVFDPSRSSTYGLVSCQSVACESLSEASCHVVSNCQYQYSYGDGSRTIGLLSTETFSFDDGGAARRVRVSHVNFGCSTYSAGTFRSDGLVGLGGGALSLVTQLGAATPFGSKFSYCLVPFYSANSSSTLNFGARAVLSEPGAATTPLVPSAVDSYYTVALESVAVGGLAVATQRSRIIVDSGTTLTFLDPALLRPLVTELERRITLPRAQSPEQLLELCYDVSGRREWGIPDVTLVFGGGAAVTLRAENTFTMVQEGTLCLAVVSVSQGQPVSILGNVAQQNFHVGYDLEKRTVTFVAADCTHSAST